MAQADTLTIFAIGISVFLGALQLKPHYRFVPILVLGGWCIIAWSAIKIVLNSDPPTWFIVSTGVVGLGVIAGVFACKTYRSSNVQDYIHIWERNYENWDGGKPNDRYDLTQQVIGEEITPVRLSLPIQKGPAKFTPVVQSLYDSIEEDACIWITVWGAGLKFENNELGEWRPVLTDTTRCGQYVGHIDRPIYPGKSKAGPDGIIKVHFQVADYRVDYKIEGMSKKGCAFTKEGHFIVHIYDGNTS